MRGLLLTNHHPALRLLRGGQLAPLDQESGLEWEQGEVLFLALRQHGWVHNFHLKLNHGDCYRWIGPQ